jgi:hypothetical protein
VSSLPRRRACCTEATSSPTISAFERRDRIDEAQCAVAAYRHGSMPLTSTFLASRPDLPATRFGVD